MLISLMLSSYAGPNTKRSSSTHPVSLVNAVLSVQLGEHPPETNRTSAQEKEGTRKTLEGKVDPLLKNKRCSNFQQQHSNNYQPRVGVLHDTQGQRNYRRYQVW